MAILDDLIQQISDEELRNRISKEVGKLTSKKKFGLVYEEHIPECTPLYDVPIKKGSTIALKNQKINDLYAVKSVSSDEVLAVHRVSGDEATFDKNDVVAVAQFGEPIYPYLKPVDSVINDPDGDLWHTLIEADNYHALQLLAYLYPHQVDCIYIDPPYNTRAKDWKYNNDYVDPSDAYKHSKWLSMMEKRLQLAKKLLNPNNSVLIVTIDEKEYLHLGMLLEDMFPEGNIQMITDIIKSEGTSRLNEFSRTNEYVFFVMFGQATVPSGKSMFETSDDEDDSDDSIKWRGLRRRESKNTRSKNPNEFYPIFIDKDTGNVTSIGDSLPVDMDRNTVPVPDHCYAVWPLMPNGTEGIWGKIAPEARKLLEKGYLYANKSDAKKEKAHIVYLQSGSIRDIDEGRIVIEGRGSHNEVVGHYISEKTTTPKSVWYQKSHNSQVHGSLLIKNILGGNRFIYPKSLYSEKDAIGFFVGNKPNALIIDFFAGSGTTLHAINLLNAEDGGNRKCIIVTNNEVSAEELQSLTEQGYKPGDDEWEKLGIARYVTWPRTVCSIEGHDVNGKPLKGEYIGSNIPMANGFKTNAAYFKLGFLDKNNVSLGRQFKELLPLLWMKAGAHHECPTLNQGSIPDMLIYPENRFAVLVEEKAYLEFEKEVNSYPEIETAFIITDSQASYRSMIKGLNAEATYQLYRDYLDNFRINTGASRK